MGDLFFSIASQYSVATYQLAAENGMTIWSRLVLGGTSDVSGTATADEDISEKEFLDNDPHIKKAINTAKKSIPAAALISRSFSTGIL